MSEKKGFTLLETLLYLGLFAIIIGGIGLMAFAVSEGANRSQSGLLAQSQGDFLIGKFNWALSGAQNFSLTASPQSLTIHKFNYPDNPLVFSYNSGSNTITLKQGGGSEVNLVSSSVTLSNLLFTELPASGLKPKGVTISFTLSAKMPNGMTVIRDFSTTKFLRQ